MNDLDLRRERAYDGFLQALVVEKEARETLKRAQEQKDRCMQEWLRLADAEMKDS